MNRVKPEQISEWAENPTTEYLLELCKEEIAAIESTPNADCLVPGEPQKTQDNLVDLNTRRYVWDTFREILEGDWSFFIEEGEESDETGYEQIGYHSQR